MLLNEISFYQPAESDNARCVNCNATYTIFRIQLRQQPQSICPSCNAVNDNETALANLNQPQK